MLFYSKDYILTCYLWAGILQTFHNCCSNCKEKLTAQRNENNKPSSLIDKCNVFIHFIFGPGSFSCIFLPCSLFLLWEWKLEKWEFLSDQNKLQIVFLFFCCFGLKGAPNSLVFFDDQSSLVLSLMEMVSVSFVFGW